MVMPSNNSGLPSSSSGISTSSSHLSVQSNNSQRPSSTLSSRPSSRQSTTRPQSRVTQRPKSSQGQRPSSSNSQRPLSRQVQRPPSRHARSRLLLSCQTLVTQITGLTEDIGDEAVDQGGDAGITFNATVEYAVKHLESATLNKGAVGTSMADMDEQIRGHALKARINSKNVLSEALLSAYGQLKACTSRPSDLDDTIRASHIPDHLQFLTTLSAPPTSDTNNYAERYLDLLKNPPPQSPKLTWEAILAEEPFEGEHWEGIYGISVSNPKYDQHRRGDWDSTPSLSPLTSDDLELDADESESLFHDVRPTLAQTFDLPAVDDSSAMLDSRPPHSYTHRKEFERLRAKQYWREDWQSDIDMNRKFNPTDPSTFGPALERASVKRSAGLAAQALLQHEKYFNEEDILRDILMALQGRKNIVLEWKDGSHQISIPAPRLSHLSLASQASIFSSFARISTTVQHLRNFVASVLAQIYPQNSRHPHVSTFATLSRRGATIRTCEAFADAVDYEIRTLDAWCASREEAICKACAGVYESGNNLILSLLSTEKAVRDEFEMTFDVLYGITSTIFGQPSESAGQLVFSGIGRRNAAVLTAQLLDMLFVRVQEHLERGDTVTSDALMRVFIRTVEPVWGMIGKWLRNGMGLGLNVGSGGSVSADELDEEFFIESNGVGIGMLGMGLLDPDFWKEGYALRDDFISPDDMDDTQRDKPPRPRAVPLFLEQVAELVLSAGKAVGLLRALDRATASTKDEFGDWGTFGELVGLDDLRTAQPEEGRLFSVSVDTLAHLVYDRLSPSCKAKGALLAQVLVDECSLWQHLGSIENLYLMRKGDAMSHFTDVLFAKMDTQQSWGDFHFLNSAFNDVVEANLSAGAQGWIQSFLVRLSYRSSARDKEQTIARTIKAVDGLTVEYAVPFPLTYIFRPAVLQIYNGIFNFLLQIRRAKSVLERILVRGESGKEARLGNELKVFYALRSRLSWFINVLLNFLTTYVFHAQVLKFHEDFRKAQSLDEMIQIHDEHLERIQSRCLLKPNTVALHRTILSILDIALNFSNAFMNFAGNVTTTHDVSHSIIIKRHRSRRQRRQKKNIIGFSQSLRDSEGSSDDDDDDDDAALEPPEPSFSIGMSSVSSVDGLSNQIDKMSSELDGLVRFVRRGVESLAGGVGQAAPAFGVLAFSLEDWDL